MEKSSSNYRGLGNIIKAGVYAATFCVIIGGVIFLNRYGLDTPDYKLFRGEPIELRTFSGILESAFAGRSRGIIQLGFLILMATPVLRVLIAFFLFQKEKTRLYAVFSLLVLVLLLYSFMGGVVHP